jgi:serine/threonine-protein kinase
MKLCPHCKRELQDQLVSCPFDGEPLSDTRAADGFVGTLLDDKYRLEEQVGKGGMGTVYRATHVHMEKSVAVKILHPHLASDFNAVERFRREARSAAQIRHPNAIAVTDFGVTRDAGIAYLVMEFLAGEDLRHKIKKERQLDLQEAFLILDQTCLAVSAAHAQGIIHRDLKPDNIWLIKMEKDKDKDKDKYTDYVKVLDFGIAKLKSSMDSVNLTEIGTIIGTPSYMSPEQCRGEELASGSDVYSLGVILYEMLTGRVPFDGTALEVVLKHITERPGSLRELRPQIPEQVERVVLRALEKSREDRQGSAVQLAQEFKAALLAAGQKFGVPGNETTLVSFPLNSYRAEPSGGNASLPSGGGTKDFGSSVAFAQRAAPISTQSTLIVGDTASRPATARETPQSLSEVAQGGTGAYLADATQSVEPKPLVRTTIDTIRSVKFYAILAAIAMLLVGVIAVAVISLSLKSHPSFDSKSIYRLRATVVDPQGMPVEDAKIWSSIGGEAKKVAGGWQFDIPLASKPAGGELTIYAAKETAFLSGKQDIQLGEDLNPASKIQLSHDTSASVTGFITDSQGRAVSGARVSIGSSPESVLTGAAGNFLLPAHAAIKEPVLVRVEKEGFRWAELWHQAGEDPATIVLERR